MSGKINIQEIRNAYANGRTKPSRPRLQPRNESIIAEAEREMMHPVDLGSPVTPPGDDHWDDDDLVEVSMPRTRDNIKAACIENGIAAFSLYASRKFRRVKNALLYDSAPIDDSWETINWDEEQEDRMQGKEQGKGKGMAPVYYSFVSSALSGNEKPRRFRGDAAVDGQEARAYHAGQRGAGGEMMKPRLRTANAPRQTETHQAASKNADSNLVQPAEKPAAKKSFEKSTEKAIEKLAQKAADRGADRAAERATEENTENTIAKCEKPAEPVAAPVKQKGKQKKKNRKYQNEDWLAEENQLDGSTCAAE
ncbi:hypothetical protein QC764_301150 [Podospora pseudoanserina]|uniref:Uncharacterized protein n=1 Tax=Podospora pseudoanserina TaxID=2609844 RepID=A0ABR0ICW7_9PEZI|nr:hypothetical protein QC764_301150 [Podospora pseudoanserina]